MIATAFNKPGPLKDANTESVQTSKAIYPNESGNDNGSKEIVITINGSTVSWHASDNITTVELIGALDITKNQIVKQLFPDTLQKLIQRN